MKNKTKKVVILENLSSPYVHQAIIVLKDFSPINENKAISDAERIVNDYLKRKALADDDIKIYENKPIHKKKKKSFFKFFLAACVLCIIGISVSKLVRF